MFRTSFFELANAGELEFGDGYRTKQSELGEPGLPILRVAEVTDGKINPGYSDTVHMSFRPRMGAKVSRPSDVILTTKGTVGRVAIMPEDVGEFVYSPQLCYFRMPDGSRLHHRYLYYWFKGAEFSLQALAMKGQTDMADYLSLRDLGALQITIPELSVQSRIIGVLGALDDKIAVNDRIVRTYEELLSVTFLRNGWGREPGSSEEAVRLPELIELNPTYPLPQGEAVYVDMASVPTDRARVVSWARRPAKSGVRFRNGDTLLARITPCLENGKTAHIDFMGEDEVGVGSTEFIVMRSKDGLPTQLSYAIARNDRFRQHAISNMVGTSGRQRCPVDALRNYTMVKPDEGDLSEFDQLARMTFDHTRSLDAESLVLAKLRDTLLPKLMSGELRVREAERVVSDAV